MKLCKRWKLDHPWLNVSEVVTAYTKSEARAMFRVITKEPKRLPIGCTIHEVLL